MQASKSAPALLPVLALLPLALLSCDGQDTEAAPGAPSKSSVSAQAPANAATRGEIRDLIVALTPPAATTTAGQKHNWFQRHREIMERLRTAGPEFGRAVLDEYHARPDALDEVRSGLLDVAAHNLPGETEPILVDLIQTFKEPLALRTAACDLLARTSPRAALDLLGPILREGKHRITYPPEERMVQAWVRAADHEGIAKGAFLGDIAVQLDREHSTRQVAVRALATCQEAAAVEALKSLMIESSGNHYLRRTATQSLREVLSAEDFCAFLREVFEQESDQDFQIFLADMLDNNCD